GGKASVPYRAVSAEAPPEQQIKRPDRLCLAADGAAGPGLGAPAIDIEMDPGARLADEPAQEQGRRDRTRERSIRNMVHIGNLAFEPGIVGLPERQPPQGIGGGGGGFGQSGG